MNQEPGSAADIIKFQAKYGVTFPVVEKSKVNGSSADAAWKWMRESHVGPTIMDNKSIEWNFHKFLIDANGQVKFSYEPHHNPLSMKDDIESLLY